MIRVALVLTFALVLPLIALAEDSGIAPPAFEIEDGTGATAWNRSFNPWKIPVGCRLSIRNDDKVPHHISFDVKMCKPEICSDGSQHGSWQPCFFLRPDDSFICTIQPAMAGAQLFDLLNGKEARFYLDVAERADCPYDGGP